MAIKLQRLRALTLLLVMLVPQWMPAYSALTHEQIVDIAWSGRIEPLLRRRFPNATAADLVEAHAYQAVVEATDFLRDVRHLLIGDLAK